MLGRFPWQIPAPVIVRTPKFWLRLAFLPSILNNCREIPTYQLKYKLNKAAIIELIIITFSVFLYLQIENRALRLRDTAATVAQYLEELPDSTSPSQLQSVQLGFLSGEVSPRLTWDYFDEIGYIQRGGLHTGEDPYVRNRFNQQASDQLPSNRVIPDTRNQM